MGGGAAPELFSDSFPATYTDTSTIIGSDRVTLENADALVNEGEYDVLVHGSTDGMAIVDGQPVNPDQISELISGNPAYPGQTCRLVVCHAGSSGFGQDAANSLGAPVWVPTGQVRALYAGGTEVMGDGYWRLFLPVLEG